MFNEDQDRRMVPRWRDSLRTVATGELTPLSTRPVPEALGIEFLVSKVADWRKHRTVSFAADLVGAAIVLGRESEVTEAAEFLLSNSSKVSSAALKLAKRILHLADEAMEPPLYYEESSTEISKKAIHDLRVRLRDDPRNALALVDIARHYSILGFNEQARRAIQKGIALAPENRFTLRSAVRFYIHVGDLEVAHDILKRSERTKSDPWLLAAEIAAATVAGRTSRLVRRGRSFLNSHTPFQTTELASAIGTLELNAGNNRGALKLFRHSLIEPTDNSVAQVEWASQRLANLEVEQQHLNTPLSYEARAWDSYLEGKWLEAYAECRRWLSDEPYSSRPAILGTFITSVALENYSEAERIARRSLKANPNSQLLLNNLAFALASAGNVEEATKFYNQMDHDQCDEGEKIAWLATGGLLSFRQRNVEDGRFLYQKAIASAKDDPLRKALAAAFLAREELLAGTPQAPFAYEAAVAANRHVKSKSMAAALDAVLKRIKKTFDQKKK